MSLRDRFARAVAYQSRIVAGTASQEMDTKFKIQSQVRYTLPCHLNYLQAHLSDVMYRQPLQHMTSSKWVDVGATKGMITYTS